MMARMLWASAALVVLVHMPRGLDADTGARVELLFLPAAAMASYLAGLAVAARRIESPPALTVAAGVGGVLFAASAAVFQTRWPALALAVAVAAGIGLIAVAAWLSVQHKRHSSAASLLVALGGTAGVVFFLRLALRAYLVQFQAAAEGLSSLLYQAREIVLGFGLSAAMLVVGGLLGSRRSRGDSVPR